MSPGTLAGADRDHAVGVDRRARVNVSPPVCERPGWCRAGGDRADVHRGVGRWRDRDAVVVEGDPGDPGRWPVTSPLQHTAAKQPGDGAVARSALQRGTAAAMAPGGPSRRTSGTAVAPECCRVRTTRSSTRSVYGRRFAAATRAAVGLTGGQLRMARLR